MTLQAYRSDPLIHEGDPVRRNSQMDSVIMRPISSPNFLEGTERHQAAQGTKPVLCKNRKHAVTSKFICAMREGIPVHNKLVPPLQTLVLQPTRMAK